MIDSTTIPVLERVLQFAQRRHGILAGNLANLDTPGYQVRDLSTERFQAALLEAIRQRHRARAPMSPGEYPDGRFGEVNEALASILYHDESDGSLEQQIAEIAKNQMQHNLALTLMISQFRLLQAAISEQVT